MVKSKDNSSKDCLDFINNSIIKDTYDSEYFLDYLSENLPNEFLQNQKMTIQKQQKKLHIDDIDPNQLIKYINIYTMFVPIVFKSKIKMHKQIITNNINKYGLFQRSEEEKILKKYLWCYEYHNRAAKKSGSVDLEINLTISYSTEKHTCIYSADVQDK